MPEFYIQRCLGRGGFGEVYRGVMSRGGGVEMDVAIKVLRPDLDPASQGVQRLRDEGRLLGRLTHPTILRVYDLVVINGRAALVSEYVGGADLGGLLREDRIPPRGVFECIAQVAAALDAAWSWPSVTDGKPLHLVHRDIKPDNIRIDPHGVVKLLDFGIAQAQTVAREAQTSVNTIMGSTQYLAPERLVQQEVGPESDVFALGCTMFEALVGEALFARRSMRQMYLLMVDERRFDQFVAERAAVLRERLGGERAVALFRAMTAWRKQSRPTAAEVAARCDQISDSTDGPTLTQWCRSREWPADVPIEGPLDGMRFTTSHIGLPVEVSDVPVAVAGPGLRPGPLPLDAALAASGAGQARRIVPPPPDLASDNGVPREKVLGESTTTAMTVEHEARSLYSGAVPWSAAELAAVLSTAPEPGIRIPQLLRQAPEAPPAPAPEVAAPPPARAVSERVPVPDTPPPSLPAPPPTDATPAGPAAAKAPDLRVPVPAAAGNAPERGSVATSEPVIAAAPPPAPPEPAGDDEDEETYDADVAPTELVVVHGDLLAAEAPAPPAPEAADAPAPEAPLDPPAPEEVRTERLTLPSLDPPRPDDSDAEILQGRPPDPATEPLGPAPPVGAVAPVPGLHGIDLPCAGAVEVVAGIHVPRAQEGQQVLEPGDAPVHADPPALDEPTVVPEPPQFDEVPTTRVLVGERPLPPQPPPDLAPVPLGAAGPGATGGAPTVPAEDVEPIPPDPGEDAPTEVKPIPSAEGAPPEPAPAPKPTPRPPTPKPPPSRAAPSGASPYAIVASALGGLLVGIVGLVLVGLVALLLLT